MRENKRKLTLKKIKIAAMNGIRGGDETTATVAGMSDGCPTHELGCESNNPECEIPASDQGNVCSDLCTTGLVDTFMQCGTRLTINNCLP